MVWLQLMTCLPSADSVWLRKFGAIGVFLRPYQKYVKAHQSSSWLDEASRWTTRVLYKTLLQDCWQSYRWNSHRFQAPPCNNCLVQQGWRSSKRQLLQTSSSTRDHRRRSLPVQRWQSEKRPAHRDLNAEECVPRNWLSFVRFERETETSTANCFHTGSSKDWVYISNKTAINHGNLKMKTLGHQCCPFGWETRSSLSCISLTQSTPLREASLLGHVYECNRMEDDEIISVTQLEDSVRHVLTHGAQSRTSSRT